MVISLQERTNTTPTWPPYSLSFQSLGIECKPRVGGFKVRAAPSYPILRRVPPPAGQKKLTLPKWEPTNCSRPPANLPAPALLQRFQPLDTKKTGDFTKINCNYSKCMAVYQVKNREIIENVWKTLPGDGSQKREVSGQNRRVGISAPPPPPPHPPPPPPPPTHTHTV